jgi:glycosyltransferase involved in cell wall biosynthesis
VNWQDRQNPRSGGAETHLHEIFGRLAQRGHDVTLLVSAWPGAEPRVRLDGMDVHRTGGRHTFPLAAAAYHRRELAGRPFDVVIEDLNKVPVFAPWWRRGTPAVLLVHHLFGTTAFQEAGLPVASVTWLLERPLPLLYRSLPVQAVSESTADDLVKRGFRRDRIAVIENGVDLDFYSPDPALARFAEPTVLYLGRLQRYKRVDIVIRAIALLRAAGLGVRLVIAGRGAERERLQRLVAELGIRDHVEFAGFVSDERKRELMRRSWVHALTSSKEGWGITNVEAAACGTATVASDAPGLRDSVRDGETGFLVPHGDVAAVADRLRRIVEDPQLRDRLGTQARVFAGRHSWDRSADRTEAHLEGVIARGSASGITATGG